MSADGPTAKPKQNDDLPANATATARTSRSDIAYVFVFYGMAEFTGPLYESFI
jgi:hypothetical protein